MTLLSSLLLTVAFVSFSALVPCLEAQDELFRRDKAFFERLGGHWEAQFFLRNESELTCRTPFNPLLDRRSSLESWMGKRQEICENANDSPCPDGNGCCPTGGICCPNSCGDQGDVCCQGGFTCPSGWGCCAVGTCYPNGGECCADGNYCTPGNVCVRLNGLGVCCTNLQCTAYVDGTVTISGPSYHSVPGYTQSVPAPPPTIAAPSIPTTTSTTQSVPVPPPTIAAPSIPTSTSTTLSVAVPSTISAAPSSPTVSVIYTYYYYYIDYTYQSWYWTVFFGESASTYTIITTETTISIYETDSEAAYSSYLDVISTLSLSTPEAATSLSNPLSAILAATTTLSANTGNIGFSGISVTISSPMSTTSSAVSVSPTVTEPAGGGGALTSRATVGGSWGFTGLVGLWIGVAGLMVWL